jgi:hypothetical protein
MSRRWKFVHGKTHSFNASDAEARGEMPITRAIDAVYKSLDCKKLKISRRRVREFLEKNCYSGWHHVAGPNGVREVSYYLTNLDEDLKNKLIDS